MCAALGQDVAGARRGVVEGHLALDVGLRLLQRRLRRQLLLHQRGGRRLRLLRGAGH
jgi:hypothetical protein